MAHVNSSLDTLHHMLVEYLTSRLIEAREKDEDGRIKAPMVAAELSVLRQFLKDNGISADKDHANDLEKLQAELAKEADDTSRKAIMQRAIETLATDEGTMH